MPAWIFCLLLSPMVLACGSKKRPEPSAPIAQEIGEGQSSGSSQTPSTSGELALDGKVLYDNHCATCHGQLNQSSAARADVATIQTAMQSIPEMQELPALQEEQVDALAQALSRIPPGKAKMKP